MSSPSLVSEEPGPITLRDARLAMVLTALGDLAVEAYDFNRAAHLVEEALQRDPKSTEALRLKARIAVLRGDVGAGRGDAIRELRIHVIEEIEASGRRLLA